MKFKESISVTGGGGVFGYQLLCKLLYEFMKMVMLGEFIPNRIRVSKLKSSFRSKSGNYFSESNALY